jgi:hypothetical protein
MRSVLVTGFLTALVVFGFSIEKAEAKSMANRHQQLAKDLKSCEGQVKKLSSMGYPEKAEKELRKCDKIQSDLAKVEQGQEKVDRKLASLEKKKKKSKKSKSKKSKSKKSKSKSHSES